MARALRQLGKWFAIVVVLGTATIVGMAAGLLVSGTNVQRTDLATVSTSVEPALRGHVSVYVPLVDWRVRLVEYAAPANINIELRSIDRARAGSGIASAAAANQSLAQIERDAKQVVEAAVQRAIIAASLGGVLGATIAGLLLVAVTLRRRWLVWAPVAGLLITAVVVVPSAIALAQTAERQVDPSPTGENAEELPKVLRFAQQLLVAGDDYERHYATALDSVDNLASFTARSRATATADRTAFVVSDIHDNVFVLDAVDDLAGDEPVFAVGDFVLVGAQVEERTAPRVAQLGGQVVAVSGNHDSVEYMEQLATAGATVLGADRDDRDDAWTELDGIQVVGYPDPLERPAGAGGRHILRVYDEEYDAQADDLIAWFDELEQWPDVLLVHQHGLAHRLAKHLEARGETRELAIFTGHDHKAHAERVGTTVIVDGGSLGAGGLAAIGEQTVSFARVHFRGPRVVSADIVQVEPLTGRATAERVDLR